MAASYWEAYLFLDAAVFAVISIYAIVRLILSSLHSGFSYKTQKVYRSLAFTLSISLSFIFFVIYFNSNSIGDSIYQTVVICLTNATCLAFFFSILEWDSICRQISFIPCQKNPIFILCISIIGVTGLCQFCSYFIRTKATPYVFFFCNNFALFVQMEFVLGTGSLYCGNTIRGLNESSDRSYSKYVKFTLLTFGAMIFMAAFGFGCFLASFCVSLDNSFYYNLFLALCGRVPRFVLLISSLLLQDLMDSTASKSIILQGMNSETFV